MPGTIVWLALAALHAPLGAAQGVPASGPRWRVCADPGRIGEQQGWFSPRFDDSAWQRAPLGALPPEPPGETAGAIWYRVWLDVPGNARRAEAAFEAGGPPGPCRVWINGFLQAERRRPARPWLVVPLGPYGRGQRVFVAICVARGDPWEGAAEPAGRVVVAAELLRGAEAGQLAARDFADLVGQLRPEQPWPAWMTGRAAQRTLVGGEGLGPCAYLADDGTVQLGRNAYSLAAALVLREDGGVRSPSTNTVTWLLSDGRLPLPVATWRATDEITVRVRPFPWVAQDRRQWAGVWFQVRNGGREPRRMLLGLTLRPYSLTGEASPIRSIRMTPGAAEVDGQEVLRCAPAATYVSASTPACGEADWVRWEGRRPEMAEAADARGLAGGVLVYDLTLPPAGTRDLVAFDWTGRDRPEAGSPCLVPPAQLVREQEAYWRERLGKLSLELPDPAGWCGEAFLTSAAYLLIGDGTGTQPTGAADAPSPQQRAFRAEALREAGFPEAAEALTAADAPPARAGAATSGDSRPASPFARIVRTAPEAGATTAWAQGGSVRAGGSPSPAPADQPGLPAAGQVAGLPYWIPDFLAPSRGQIPPTPELLDQWWEELAAPTGGGVGDQTHVFGPGMALGALWAQAQQRDRAAAVLQWYLAYETSRHMHAWGETLDPATGEYVQGALPDLDAAAAFIRLVRASVALESGDQLCLLAGLPADWLLSGWPLRLSGLPTAFGPLELLVQSAGQELRIETGPDCRPPGGYVISLPAEPRAEALRIDRQSAVLGDPTRVEVPPGAHSVAILFPGSDAA